MAIILMSGCWVLALPGSMNTKEMTVEQLVSHVSTLPTESQRKIGSVIGAVVGNAASVPLEWLYTDEEMQAAVGDNTTPEFWPTCHCPFYTLPTGSLDCYGDELVTGLTSLANKEAQLDLNALSEDIMTLFGDPEGAYQVALAKREDEEYPVAGPWITGGMIQSLANMAAGVVPSGSAECDDNDGFAVALPAFLSSLDQDEGASCAELLTTTQLAGDHLKAQTALVEAFLGEGEDPVGAVIEQLLLAGELPSIIGEMEDVRLGVAAGKTAKDMVAEFGKACPLPGSFQGALAVLLTCENNFVTAIRQNILAGGDCNGRALQIGAWLGARQGMDSIPFDWIMKVNGIDKILVDAIRVFA